MKTCTRFPRKDRGFSLFVAMIILILLNLLMLMMVRTAIMQDTMTGNTREKGRALQAAQNAMAYAEWWLRQSSSSSGNCNDGRLAQPAICDQAVRLTPLDKTPDKSPLSTWVEYQPSSDPKYWQTGKEGGQDVFYRNPGFHIQYLQTASGGKSNYYQITAFGYGGNQQTVAVTQSLYAMSLSSGGTTVTNLGEP
ncbi:MAG: PilX N-terminal domain-containing pilus assembly protein [Betaproteobacteria bacterium]|nr:PilX N-terminal domain-containing pilus assembly protein [Betaproteobacteria bacterium]